MTEDASAEPPASLNHVNLDQVSVVIPALNEEDTVGGVVEAVASESPGEILVIDSDSTDSTAARAQTAGARVLSWREIAPHIEPRPGKGEALWRGVVAARGEIVVFIDADLTAVPEAIVQKLSAPLADDSVHLVKADYSRTFHGQPTGGGRVTELTAKPLLSTYFPHIKHINQPLGGEYAIRRSSALALPFVEGYGVEAGLLIDCAQHWGSKAVVQASIGSRQHRNRPLGELAPMADLVTRTILGRAGVLPNSVEPPRQRSAWNTLGTR
ncbi:glucosyl-3-phosphoglycerate synthase [Corynebacterium cystitidis]|uniref:glucosyl-3-phosphoglycerate synthase n=1 Tax=Corynebacterium cystitidis TaxID=35757 RepID=UPI00211E4C18|nr:glucosyl-3-phosphoglycerate synthase [Corynebacterium cystitidis]